MSDLAAAGQSVPAQTAFRVLVVEDDPDMATLLAHMVTQQGMEADIVYDGAAAMAAVGHSPPDLVLLDIMLADANGFEICQRLKADPATALIPVVLVTSLEDHESRVRGIEVALRGKSEAIRVYSIKL